MAAQDAHLDESRTETEARLAALTALIKELQISLTQAQAEAVDCIVRPPLVGLVAELPPKLARGPAGRDDFGPRMGGTLSTHSTHSTLATGASTSTLQGFKMTLKSAAGNSLV